MVVCYWTVCGDPPPPGESEVWRFLINFGRPLPSVPLFFLVTFTGDSGSVLPDSLWMVNVRSDFVNRPSGPRGPVPLLLGYCVISEIGLLMCFQCKILLSAVVTV